MSGGWGKVSTNMPGEYEIGPSRCRLVEPQCVPEWMRHGLLELTDLETEEGERGKGYGANLLWCVTAKADTEGISLILMAESKRLQTWYEKFGFVVFQESPCLMVRKNER